MTLSTQDNIEPAVVGSIRHNESELLAPKTPKVGHAHKMDMNLPTALDTIALEKVIVKSPYSNHSTQETTKKIIADYNQGRPTIMTHGYNWLFTHRLVMPNEFRLVEKNGVPELVGTSDIPLRRQKFFNFVDSSSTLGIFKQTEPLIGANGHYVVNVPPGRYAKVFDGNKAMLLDCGQHVIHSDNFRFNPEQDLIKQTDDYIHHNDLHILRVPQGKVAIVRINNETMFLEHCKEPYIFKTLQFQLISSSPALFHEANSKILTAGTKIRFIPDAGEVGVLNANGHFEILKHGTEQKTSHMVKDIGTARFEGFLSTNLQNVEFPSETVHKRNLEQGIDPKNANFDYFYTADQVKVGVKFLVNYRITDPQKTLSTLKLSDIRAHIESVVTADMGNAIKQTSMQNLMASNLSKIDEKDSSTIDKEDFNYWQDAVKSKLKLDLAEYGIELIRLNIEEAKILNEEIEQQMSQQAIAYAKAHAQKLALDANLGIKKAEAEQHRQLAEQQQETDSQIAKIKANKAIEIAEMEAQALKITTDAEVYNQREKAKVLQESPQAMLMNFLKEFREALANGNFSSALPLSDLSNIMATFMAQIQEVMGIKKSQPQPEKKKVSFFFNPESAANNDEANAADISHAKTSLKAK